MDLHDKYGEGFGDNRQLAWEMVYLLNNLNIPLQIGRIRSCVMNIKEEGIRV